MFINTVIYHVSDCNVVRWKSRSWLRIYMQIFYCDDVGYCHAMQWNICLFFTGIYVVIHVYLFLLYRYGLLCSRNTDNCCNFIISVGIQQTGVLWYINTCILYNKSAWIVNIYWSNLYALSLCPILQCISTGICCTCIMFYIYTVLYFLH